jgi:hypothetical protein
VINLYLADGNRSYLEKILQVSDVHVTTQQLHELPSNDRAAFLAALTGLISQSTMHVPIYLALTINAELRDPLAVKLTLTGLAARVGTATPCPGGRDHRP